MQYSYFKTLEEAQEFLDIMIASLYSGYIVPTTSKNPRHVEVRVWF